MQTPKRYLQNLLRRMGLYQRLRASIIYDFYWRLTDKSLIEAQHKEVDFYRDLLCGFHAGDLIFDVGANQGSKTSTFLRLGAQVVAVEPDEANQGILREMFLQYRLTPKPVVIVGKALSDRCGTETMWIDEAGSAKNTLSQKWVDTLRTDADRFGHSLDFGEHKRIETTTLEQLFKTHGCPFFIKIDVEGYEPQVLRGMQSPVPYLSFEVNLPEFRPEGLQCVELLANLAANGRFNYAVDCLQGLAMETWLDAGDFSRVLGQCTDPSVEVFWKTPAAARA